MFLVEHDALHVFSFFLRTNVDGFGECGRVSRGSGAVAVGVDGEEGDHRADDGGDAEDLEGRGVTAGGGGGIVGEDAGEVRGDQAAGGHIAMNTPSTPAICCGGQISEIAALNSGMMTVPTP